MFVDQPDISQELQLGLGLVGRTAGDPAMVGVTPEPEAWIPARSRPWLFFDDACGQGAEWLMDEGRGAIAP